MIGDIKPIESNKYPRDVRDALNEVIKRLNRPTEIVYGDVESPTWDQGSNKEQIMLPKGASGSFIVCRDNGDDTFTELIATFTNGMLTSLE